MHRCLPKLAPRARSLCALSQVKHGGERRAHRLPYALPYALSSALSDAPRPILLRSSRRSKGVSHRAEADP